MEFYHIDRSGQLHVGRTINLFPIGQIVTDLRQEIVQGNIPPLRFDFFENYADGLSNHGDKYAAHFQKHLNFLEICEYNQEFIFELIRLKQFPHKPSRFQSVFAFENIEQAAYWQSILGSDNKIVKLRVDHKQYSRHDAAFLQGGLAPHPDDGTLSPEELKKTFLYSAPQYYSSAVNYWSGSDEITPSTEILIKPPVTVVEIVRP